MTIHAHSLIYIYMVRQLFLKPQNINSKLNKKWPIWQSKREIRRPFIFKCVLHDTHTQITFIHQSNKYQHCSLHLSTVIMFRQMCVHTPEGENRSQPINLAKHNPWQRATGRMTKYTVEMSSRSIQTKDL